MDTPTCRQFRSCVTAFERHEQRDAMYKVATLLMTQAWGRPADMADALGVLLLTWNQAWYRYGSFDFAELEACIASHLPLLRHLRRRTIFTFDSDDEAPVEALFLGFLNALVRTTLPGRSPVAAAKALHILAPGFLPLWDAAIAAQYVPAYHRNPERKYVRFCWQMKELARTVQGYCDPGPKTVLKLIDEYNYARYTKKWCCRAGA